jgi:hypothetical protein
MVENSKINLNLLDFGIVGEELSIGELLHSSYARGREDFQKEIESDFTKNIQSAAHSSSLLKSKLLEIGVEVKDMYLKIVDFNAFKCLVIISKDDYFSEDRRWKSYNISEHINNTNSRIDLTFSFMAFTKELVVDNITSDGYIFKYGTEKV